MTLTKPQRVPLREQVVAILKKQMLAKLPPGGRLPSEARLAEMCSVSVHAIREGLALLAQQGLIDRRHGSGTYRSPGHPSRLIGILSELDITSPRVSYFFARTVRQFHRFFVQHGYQARTYIGDLKPVSTARRARPCQEFVDDLKEGRLGGLVIMAARPHRSWLPHLRKSRIPVLGGQPFSRHFLRSNLTQMVESGIRFLLEKKRFRIALMGWGGKGRPWKGEQIFRSLMRSARLPICPQWIRHDVYPNRPNAGWDEFHQIWRARKIKPNGLLICDDQLLHSAAMAIYRLQIRVPGDLLVVSQANRGSGITVPFPVSLMEYDPDQYVRTAGAIMLDLLNGRKPDMSGARFTFRWVHPR